MWKIFKRKKKECPCDIKNFVVKHVGGFQTIYYECTKCGKLTEEISIYDFNGELVREISKQILCKERTKKLNRIV